MLSQGHRLRRVTRMAPTAVGVATGTEERGSIYPHHLVLLVSVCMDSDQNHGLHLGQGGTGTAVQVWNIRPVHGDL